MTNPNCFWIGFAAFVPALQALDQGRTYGLTGHTQHALGYNFGVTMSAPDSNPLIDLSWRF